jgi:C4-dicarboxylate transporter
VIGLLISAIGVHPIVTVAVIGGTVKASAYGVSPTYMAMVLAIVWAIGISISPSAANIIAVAGLAESSPIEVGLRWNGKYAFISAVVLILLVTLFRTAQLL